MEDSDDSQEALPASWSNSRSIRMQETDTLKSKSKGWKEVAMANASHRKRQRKRTKSQSMADLIGCLEADQNNSLDSDNYLLKTQDAFDSPSRNRSPRITTTHHSRDYELKDIPIARKTQAERNHSLPPVAKGVHSQWSSTPELTTTKKWDVSEANNSDDYSVVSYSKIRSIQEKNQQNGVCEAARKLERQIKKDYWDDPEEKWRNRQRSVEDERASPLPPPPPDFSDSDESHTVEDGLKLEPESERSRFHPVNTQNTLHAESNRKPPSNVPVKPPRKHKLAAPQKVILNYHLNDCPDYEVMTMMSYGVLRRLSYWGMVPVDSSSTRRNPSLALRLKVEPIQGSPSHESFRFR